MRPEEILVLLAYGRLKYCGKASCRHLSRRQSTDIGGWLCACHYYERKSDFLPIEYDCREEVKVE